MTNNTSTMRKPLSNRRTMAMRVTTSTLIVAATVLGSMWNCESLLLPSCGHRLGRPLVGHACRKNSSGFIVPSNPSLLENTRSFQSRRQQMALFATEKDRENEIRRKIMELKKEGKLKSQTNDPTSSSSEAKEKSNAPLTPLEKIRQERERQRLSRSGGNSSTVADEYADKLSSKLGGSRAKTNRLLSKSGSGVSSGISKKSNVDFLVEGSSKPKAKLGVLGGEYMEELLGDDDDDGDYGKDYNLRERSEVMSEAASDAIKMLRRNIEGEEEEREMDEEDMVDIVAKALGERDDIVRSSSTKKWTGGKWEPSTSSETAKEMTSTATTTATTGEITSGVSEVKTTSGVGGSWTSASEKQVEEYLPSKSGTWGAFPRPRNISVAYGGGKRVGAGVNTDERRRQESIESTKEKLRAYREKMGIVVQSEIDNEEVIQEALDLAARAMQRGSYNAGVSCLEKVTKYCSTKSKLGGKVFLELAMAYEAEGKTDQAISLYGALTKSPIEQIKMNADRLLYGLEAMNFMRNEAKLKEFSRTQVKETFVDATGFRDITKNFDKVYNTAYIDLDKGSQYYRMLTENVVRSTREARQILLKAVGAGEVERLKIVQALRSISRHFDDALSAEKEQEKSKNVPVDYAGRPIVTSRRSSNEAELAKAIGMDGFVLSEASQTLDNLDGEWRLQLMADRKGDGVTFFNTTDCWQTLDVSDMAFRSETPGFRFSSQTGDLGFNKKERILSREDVSSSGGGLFSYILGGGKMGTAGEMMNVPQQILSVDSTLLVTRAVVKAPAVDNVKDYFSVWRRMERGTRAAKK